MVEATLRKVSERLALAVPRRGVIGAMGKGIAATGIALATWKATSVVELAEASHCKSTCSGCGGGLCQCPFCATCGNCPGCDQSQAWYTPAGCTYQNWNWTCCVAGCKYVAYDYKCPCTGSCSGCAGKKGCCAGPGGTYRNCPCYCKSYVIQNFCVSCSVPNDCAHCPV